MGGVLRGAYGVGGGGFHMGVLGGGLIGGFHRGVLWGVEGGGLFHRGVLGGPMGG